MRASEPEPGALFFVVLAAGRGLRMGPLGETQPKSLLPVLDRPLVEWQLDTLHKSGLRCGCLVAGHQAAPLLQCVGDGSRFGLELCIAHQQQPLGIAHALACAAPLRAPAFVCLLGDVWCVPEDLATLMGTFEASGADGVLAVLPGADAGTRARNYAVECISDGTRDGAWSRVTRVVEKPRDGLGGPTGIGLYAFRSSFLEAVERTPPSALRGERELTDAIGTFLDGGARVLAATVEGPDFNLSGPDDLLALNLHALERSRRAFSVAADAEVESGVVLQQAVIGARARILRGARLERALVLPDQVVPAGDYRGGLFACGRWIPEGGGLEGAAGTR